MCFTRTVSGLLTLVATGTSTVWGLPPNYHVTDLEAELEALFPGNMFLSSQCRALNENGDAVGEVHLDDGSQQAWIFTFEHGVTLLPGVTQGSSVQASDLTDRDANGEIIIVGGSVVGVHDYNIAPIVWRCSALTGQILETRDVGNLPGATEGELYLVNNSGIALGRQGENVFNGLTRYDVNTDTLEAWSFPAIPADLSNTGLVVGGRYVGDLDGNATQLSIPPDCTSLVLTGVSDSGIVVGRAGRPYSDGAGRTLASWVRYDEAGWLVQNPAGSPWDSAFAVNNAGDFTIGYGPGWVGGAYFAELGDQFGVNSLLPPEIAFRYNIAYAYGINDNQQIAAYSGHAVILTPTGRMIIPGDVNGDVSVDHQDHCDWTANPIDLDGDGDADADDELWLIDRLAVFGYIVQDCNANGVNDSCDIAAGASDCNNNGIPDECEDDCDGNGVPDDCESDCNGNGIPDACEIASGAVDDCNNNGIPDECDDAETVDAVTIYDPPVLLHQDVIFTDSVLITQTGTVADVDFTLHDAFRVGQVTVRLSHAGVTVTLIDRPGGSGGTGGFGYVNLGYDITLDDQATGPNIQTVGETCCSFESIVSPPSYTPNEPLSAFDGLPREGVWTFEFIGGFPQAFDPKLFSWGINVTDEAVDPGLCCPADFDGDGDADGIDVGLFLQAYGTGSPAADLDVDGDTDGIDVGLFLQAYGAGC